MIAEDYVSFETAKLLKEKGFDAVECQNSPHFAYNIDGQFSGPSWDTEYNAPTLQMAMKWLREVHNIAINIGWGEVFEKDYRWWCIIISQKNGEILRDSEYHKTYEEACEAAIKYCLENLI